MGALFCEDELYNDIFIDPYNDPGNYKTAYFDNRGGELITDDYEYKLVVSPSAVQELTEIGISTVPYMSTLLDKYDNLNFDQIYRIIDFMPEEISFNNRVTLYIKVNMNEIQNLTGMVETDINLEYNLALYVYDKELENWFIQPFEIYAEDGINYVQLNFYRFAPIFIACNSGLYEENILNTINELDDYDAPIGDTIIEIYLRGFYSLNGSNYDRIISPISPLLENESILLKIGNKLELEVKPYNYRNNYHLVYDAAEGSLDDNYSSNKLIECNNSSCGNIALSKINWKKYIIFEELSFANLLSESISFYLKCQNAPSNMISNDTLTNADWKNIEIINKTEYYIDIHAIEIWRNGEKIYGTDFLVDQNNNTYDERLFNSMLTLHSTNPYLLFTKGEYLHTRGFIRPGASINLSKITTSSLHNYIVNCNIEGYIMCKIQEQLDRWGYGININNYPGLLDIATNIELGNNRVEDYCQSCSESEWCTDFAVDTLTNHYKQMNSPSLMNDWYNNWNAAYPCGNLNPDYDDIDLCALFNFLGTNDLDFWNKYLTSKSIIVPVNDPDFYQPKPMDLVIEKRSITDHGCICYSHGHTALVLYFDKSIRIDRITGNAIHDVSISHIDGNAGDRVTIITEEFMDFNSGDFYAFGSTGMFY